MKKKVLLLGTGLVVGSALVVTSAFAGAGGASGYEAYKAAIKQTAQITNATRQIEVTMQDNGKQLLRVDTTVKSDRASGKSSGQGTITASGVTESFAYYDLGDQQVIKPGDEDTYFLMTEERGKFGRHGKPEFQHDRKFSGEMENVVDALVGNLKNEVIAHEGENGQQTIEMTLTGSRIPSAFNVIGSFAIKEALGGDHARKAEHMPAPAGALGIDVERMAAEFPKLTQNVNIDEVALRATVGENGAIAEQEIAFTITGQDAAGATHEVVIRADITASDVGVTTPDTVDLAGKQVETLDPQKFDR